MSSDEEVEKKSKEAKEDTPEEGTESLVDDKDFEVFYRRDETEDIASSSRLATTFFSEDQETNEFPKVMVLEKRMLDLLSLLESHARTATPEVLIVPRPSILVLPPPSQTELADKKWK